MMFLPNSQSNCAATRYNMDEDARERGQARRTVPKTEAENGEEPPLDDLIHTKEMLQATLITLNEAKTLIGRQNLRGRLIGCMLICKIEGQKSKYIDQIERVSSSEIKFKHSPRPFPLKMLRPISKLVREALFNQWVDQMAEWGELLPPFAVHHRRRNFASLLARQKGAKRVVKWALSTKWKWIRKSSNKTREHGGTPKSVQSGAGNANFCNPNLPNPQFWNPNWNPNLTNPQFWNPNLPNPQFWNPNWNPNLPNPQFWNPNMPPNPVQYGARNPNLWSPNLPNPVQYGAANTNSWNPNKPSNPVRHGAGNPNLPPMMAMSSNNRMALQHHQQYQARAPPFCAPILPPPSSSSSYGAGPPPLAHNQAIAVFIKFNEEWLFMRFFDPDRGLFTRASYCRKNSCKLQPGMWAHLDFQKWKGGGRQILIAQYRVLHESSSNSTLDWAIRNVQPANQWIWRAFTRRVKRLWTTKKLMEMETKIKEKAAAQANNDPSSSSSSSSFDNKNLTGKQRKKLEQHMAQQQREMQKGMVPEMFRQKFGEEVLKILVDAPKLIQLFQLDQEEFKRIATGLFVRCKVFNTRTPKRRLSLQQIRTVTFGGSAKGRYTSDGTPLNAMIQFHDPDLRGVSRRSNGL